MKKKSKDQRWRWICAGSLLLASLSGNLEASGLSHPDVNPMEVSQTVRKLRGTILDTNGTPVIGASISVKGSTTGWIYARCDKWRYLGYLVYRLSLPYGLGRYGD